MKRAWIPLALVVALVLAACGGEVVTTPDAGCGEPGTPPDQPAIGCPAEIDLGCIDPSGAPIDFAVSSTTCNGRDATVVCTPADDAIVTPGTTQGRCVATAPSGASAECTFPIRYRIAGVPMIQCGAAITSACTAPRTPVTLEPAAVMQSCEGGAISDPSSDAPAGFSVGTTTVTWTASVEGGAPLSCAVDVTIEDTTPPSIDCTGAPTTLVRTSPGDAIAIDAPAASDACDDAVDVSVAPAPTTRGAHAITATATDEAGLTSRCEWIVTVYDAFAPRGLRVVSAELASDGSTDVTLGWEPSESPDVTRLRLERASSEAGPWAEIETVPASITTYTDASMPSPRAFYRLVAIADVHDGGVTPAVRALAIDDGEYHLRDQAVPTVPFATSLFGVVRHPIDLSDGPYPLVVFLHGNHGNCRSLSDGDDDCSTLTAHECAEPGYTTAPNAHGYVYLQETLSAQGFVTVSLSANALNCRDDYIGQRTQLILAHLRRWASWSASASGPFGSTFVGHLDLSRVSLVGHSRGGEAVAATPAALASAPIAGLSLASVFAIGPTDYHQPTPSGVPFAVLLPGCDADVRTLEGLLQYDRGLDPSDPNARAQVLYIGANHNFFNSEWRNDDNDSIVRVCSASNLVGGPAQRGMLEIVLADWIRATTDEARLPAYVRAESDTPALVTAWAGRAIDLRWSYAAAMRRVIDDFTGLATPSTNDLGGANTYASFIAEITCTGTCARNYPHATGAIRFAWRDAAATAIFDVPDVDASGYDVLSMRFASRIATINDGLIEHDLAVRVRDASGTVAEVPVSTVGRIAHRYASSAEREILSTVRVPLAVLRGTVPSLDLAHLDTVELVMPVSGGNTEGSIWMADLDLAGD